MRIGITGITGLIGSALAAHCKARGHYVTGFSRKNYASLPHCHNLRQFSLSHPVNVNGLDALIHLSGEPVMGIWTAEKRRKIVASRRDTTRHLVNCMSRARKAPAVFLSASGTGYYGDRGSEKLTEESGRGSGFLSEVAQVWEEEARAAGEAGIRTCQLRTGVVLAKNGGAFAILRRVFALGLGGKLGSGQQFLPWIHLEDIAALYLHCLETKSLEGPLNAVAPMETTNSEFTRALGSALHRPTIFPVPEFILKMSLGQLSSTVLDSQRALANKALDSGFKFRHSTLDSAFLELLHK